MKQFSEILKAKGLKVTPQRLAIYNSIHNGVDKHPNAEIIYKLLESAYPSMSLATVYKTLDTFKNHGLLQELNIGEQSFRYDTNTASHPHLICNQCHSIVDLSNVHALNDFRKEIEATGFIIKSEQLYFYGICETCNTSCS